MDKPRHPQVVRPWKVERLKQRAPGSLKARLPKKPESSQPGSKQGRS